MTARLRGLYAITPEGPGLIDKVRQALDGGIALLQYRSKNGDDPDEARQLAGLAREHGVPFIINDDVELALALDADGVHLGRDDGDLAGARAAMKGKLLGASCYNDLGLARRAVAAGADYVAFGSVYPSSTKPRAPRASLSLFADARRLGVPLCAIGGITLENSPALLAAGADLLAVISDLFDAPDIRQRALQYKRLLS